MVAGERERAAERRSERDERLPPAIASRYIQFDIDAANIEGYGEATVLAEVTWRQNLQWHQISIRILP
jgi:hypothetical protein